MDGWLTTLSSVPICGMSNTFLLCSVTWLGSMMPLLFPLFHLPEEWKLTIQWEFCFPKQITQNLTLSYALCETFSPPDLGAPHYPGSPPKLLVTLLLASLHSLSRQELGSHSWWSTHLVQNRGNAMVLAMVIFSRWMGGVKLPSSSTWTQTPGSSIQKYC